MLGGCNAADNLRKRAEEVREGIVAGPFLTESGPVGVSVSTGAITIEDWNKTTPIEPFLKEADVGAVPGKSDRTQPDCLRRRNGCTVDRSSAWKIPWRTLKVGHSGMLITDAKIVDFFSTFSAS